MGGGTLILLFIGLAIIVLYRYLNCYHGKSLFVYYHFTDSNKLLAVATAFFSFMYFKNANVKPNKYINAVSSGCFGVLCIHANSDAMRQWLWKDFLNNVGAYSSSVYILHFLASVFGIYIVCTVIDLLRIKFIEKPFFKWYDKKVPRLFDRFKKEKPVAEKENQIGDENK